MSSSIGWRGQENDTAELCGLSKQFYRSLVRGVQRSALVLEYYSDTTQFSEKMIR
jgi:hypothetical protein